MTTKEKQIGKKANHFGGLTPISDAINAAVTEGYGATRPHDCRGLANAIAEACGIRVVPADPGYSLGSSSYAGSTTRISGVTVRQGCSLPSEWEVEQNSAPLLSLVGQQWSDCSEVLDALNLVLHTLSLVCIRMVASRSQRRKATGVRFQRAFCNLGDSIMLLAWSPACEDLRAISARELDAFLLSVLRLMATTLPVDMWGWECYKSQTLCMAAEFAARHHVRRPKQPSWDLLPVAPRGIE